MILCGYDIQSHTIYGYNIQSSLWFYIANEERRGAHGDNRGTTSMEVSEFKHYCQECMSVISCWVTIVKVSLVCVWPCSGDHSSPTTSTPATTTLQPAHARKTALGQDLGIIVTTLGGLVRLWTLQLWYCQEQMCGKTVVRASSTGIIIPLHRCSWFDGK